MCVCIQQNQHAKNRNRLQAKLTYTITHTKVFDTQCHAKTSSALDLLAHLDPFGHVLWFSSEEHFVDTEVVGLNTTFRGYHVAGAEFDDAVGV